MKKTIVCALLLTALPLMQSCGDKAPAENTPKKNDAKATALPESLSLSTKPDGAISVVEAREKADPGKEVVIVGDIGGRVPPFVDKRAAFVLADETKIISCDKKCGGCKTPWDYCCFQADEIAKAILLIQVVDDKGKVVKKSLRDFNGIKELSKVVVVGTFDETTTKTNPIVNATGIYVVK